MYLCHLNPEHSSIPPRTLPSRLIAYEVMVGTLLYRFVYMLPSLSNASQHRNTILFSFRILSFPISSSYEMAR